MTPSESTASPSEADFDEVLGLIDAARTRAVATVNTTLIELYWSIGEFITRKIADDGWGKGTVETLAQHIRRNQPNARGFSVQNLWRMRQFYQTYREQSELSALLRELSWTHNLLIMGKTKRDEEREFYLRMAREQKWSSRELERQLDGALFERIVLAPPNLSPALRELHPEAATVFKDSYLVEFLELPSDHSEADLQQALVERLKQFLIELGRDFCFVGSQFTLQVGGRDFAVDLLFFHRGLQCLVAIELKIEEFQPEHLGKLEFYLEALDRDVKNPHEQPSIGSCCVPQETTKSSSTPCRLAGPRRRVPDPPAGQKLLRAKLHEFYEQAEFQARLEVETKSPSPATPKKAASTRKKAGKK